MFHRTYSWRSESSGMWRSVFRTICHSTRRHILEESYLHIRRCENLGTHVFTMQLFFCAKFNSTCNKSTEQVRITYVFSAVRISNQDLPPIRTVLWPSWVYRSIVKLLVLIASLVAPADCSKTFILIKAVTCSLSLTSVTYDPVEIVTRLERVESLEWGFPLTQQ